MPAFSAHLEAALRRAMELATDLRHEEAGPEHLLLALLDEPTAADTLRACNVNLDALRTQLVAYLDGAPLATDGREPQVTTSFQRVVHRAVVHVQSSARAEVTGANLLVAIFAERCNAVLSLQAQGMTRFDAVQYISHRIPKRPASFKPNIIRRQAEDIEPLL